MSRASGTRLALIFLSAFLTFLAPRPTFRCAPDSAAEHSEFIVWNVGQGLWTTLVSGALCAHFDVGGEFAPFKKIKALCAQRQNTLQLSHWDSDHVNLISKAVRLLNRKCLNVRPAGSGSSSKNKIIDALPVCAEKNPSGLFLSNIRAREEASKTGRSRSNDLSNVFVVADHAGGNARSILIPGDSPRSQEKLWIRNLTGSAVWLLVLGHHGSRTSTSLELLRTLPNVRMAIASARSARYGHPHATVVKALKRAGIALLKTEDWGTLRFELPHAESPTPAH